jgi:DNA replication protein DnaC
MSMATDTLDNLKDNLRRLGLKKMLEILDEALETAQKLSQGYVGFLSYLVDQELSDRLDRRRDRRIKEARFPEHKTLDAFDFAFQPSISVEQVKDLHELRFIDEARPVLILGKPGTGKSHLAISLGLCACCHGYTVRFYTAHSLVKLLYASMADDSTDRLLARLARIDLLVIDDLGYLRCTPEHASLFFDLICSRYQQKAIVITSNISMKEWGRSLGDEILTSAVIDRLMHRASVINIKRGKSWRTEGPESPQTPPDNT